MVTISNLLTGHVKSCGGCNKGTQFATWINSPENAERLRRLHEDPAFKAKRAEINRSPEHRAKMSEAKTSHGMSRHPLYGTWRNMLTRCMNPQSRDYENYGGRGIKIYERWQNVTDFIAWIEANLGPRPKSSSLDRIDPDGDYEPGNVRWATFAVQAANKRQAAWLSDRHWRVIFAALSESGSPGAAETLEALAAQVVTDDKANDAPLALDDVREG